MALSIAPLFSGSKGNSILIGTERAKILIDAGFSCARIMAELAKIDVHISEIKGILVTHEHTDHIAGIGSVSRKYDIPIYANEPTWCEMAPKTGAISQKNIRVITEDDFYIEDMCIQPFEIDHDAAMPFAYTVHSGGKKISVMTDLGQVTERVLDRVRDSNIVLLESNHDIEMLRNGRYPQYLKRRILSKNGHLSNDDAAKTALRLVVSGVKGILLGHLSENNNDHTLAYETVCGHLFENGIVAGRHVAVGIAKQEGVTGYYAAK
ncbi:MAG: MBL fold metallo-hydrolase [Christensenellaceae bacterium]